MFFDFARLALNWLQGGIDARFHVEAFCGLIRAKEGFEGADDGVGLIDEGGVAGIRD